MQTGTVTQGAIAVRRGGPSPTGADLGPTGIEAYAPAAIAERLSHTVEIKARLHMVPLMTLAVLAGAFIAFGAALYTMTVAGSEPTNGFVRLGGGVAFSLGLVLVVVAGAELFSGNALMSMAAVEGRVGWGAVLRNWTVVLVGNAIGAVGVAFLFHLAGILDGPMGARAILIAQAKVDLSAAEIFWRAVGCNILVCLAVWMSLAARSVTGKVLVIVPPIAAFVTLGLEHSIANFYLVPQGVLAGATVDLARSAMLQVVVVAGNLLGGAGGVATAYRLAYGVRQEVRRSGRVGA